MTEHNFPGDDIFPGYEDVKPPTVRRVNLKYVGPANVPQEIKRMRREAGDLLRRYGQPVVHFHMWNLDDVARGIAQPCPACFDDRYKAPRNDCQICFGVGFASVDNGVQFLDEDGYLTTQDTGVYAPRYGGFAQGVITRIIEPDTSVDVFRINQQGVLVKTQNAQGFAYFDPYMGDNDLIVNVQLSADGRDVINAFERYQLKQVNPNTIRGWGRKAHDQAYAVNQQFEMNRVPVNNVLYQVPALVQYEEI